MDEKKRMKLEADAWMVAGPKEFVHLTDEDMATIEMSSSTSMGTWQEDQGRG